MLRPQSRNTIVKKQRASISRIVMSGFTILLLSVVIYGLASIFSYFHSSTGTVNKYDVGLSQLAHHTPPVTWLPDDPDIKGEINPYVRKEIEQSYIDAWGILNLSIQHQADLGLKENWSDRKTKQLTNTFTSSATIIREDLNHNINLHFISYDKQVVSFTDERVGLSTRIEHKGYVTTQTDTSDYKIIMTLDDGKWRVNKFLRVR